MVKQLELPFPPEVEWRDIPGYEGYYQISSTCVVKGLKRIVARSDGGTTTRPEAILAQQTNEWGYMTVGLNKNRKRKHMLVHRIMLLAFVGECPDGMEINHKNGNKNDNRLENLEYCTHSENQKHACNVLGFVTRGVRHGRAKLNDGLVREIRYLHANGMSHSKLSAKYHVSEKVIYCVVNRKSWRHVE